jgi:hypothetical protein
VPSILAASIAIRQRRSSHRKFNNSKKRK